MNGFDHTPFDEVQQGWHEHLFPYKLSQYRKKLLTKPQCLLDVDFAQIVSMEESEWLGLSINQTVTLPVTTAGKCHCVAIWVDFGFPSTSSKPSDRGHSSTLEVEYFRTAHPTISSSDSYEFPLYHTCSLKFFPEPVTVEIGSSLKGRVEFETGDSDFTFAFEF